MKDSTTKPMQQLSNGTGLLWTLRSVFTPHRDVSLKPEGGVFEAEDQFDRPEAPTITRPKFGQRRQRWITPNLTYKTGGELTQVYVKHTGLRLVTRA